LNNFLIEFELSEYYLEFYENKLPLFLCFLFLLFKYYYALSYFLFVLLESNIYNIFLNYIVYYGIIDETYFDFDFDVFLSDYYYYFYEIQYN
jgi:hypothetical protein